MPRTNIPLEVIDIANPCPAEWDAMRGDDRVRFCKHCSLNVYNISGMTRADAEALVAEKEGRLCVRFYRREDGTVLTIDCENAWQRAAKRVRRLAGAAAAFAIWAVVTPLGLSRLATADSSVDCSKPATVQPPAPRALMGDIAIPQPPQPPPQIMGKIRPPATQQAKMGFVAQPVMGTPAPIPFPPATEPATTQPSL